MPSIAKAALIYMGLKSVNILNKDGRQSLAKNVGSSLQLLLSSRLHIQLTFKGGQEVTETGSDTV